MKKNEMKKLSLVRAVVKQLSQAQIGHLAGGSVDFGSGACGRTDTCHAGCKSK